MDWPEHIVCLARAFVAGEDVSCPLHDALCEIGLCEEANHFVCSDGRVRPFVPCVPGNYCVVINRILGCEEMGAWCDSNIGLIYEWLRTVVDCQAGESGDV